MIEKKEEEKEEGRGRKGGRGREQRRGKRKIFRRIKQFLFVCLIQNKQTKNKSNIVMLHFTEWRSFLCEVSPIFFIFLASTVYLLLPPYEFLSVFSLSVCVCLLAFFFIFCLFCLFICFVFLISIQFLPIFFCLFALFFNFFSFF